MQRLRRGRWGRVESFICTQDVSQCLANNLRLLFRVQGAYTKYSHMWLNAVHHIQVRDVRTPYEIRVLLS